MGLMLLVIADHVALFTFCTSCDLDMLSHMFDLDSRSPDHIPFLQFDNSAIIAVVLT